MTALKIIGLTLAFIIVFYGIGFITTGGDLAIYRFWAPKQENARRVVFENTQSYVEGKVTYLGRLQFEYQSATGAQKDALRVLILNEAATIPEEKLTPNLQIFLNSLKRGAL